MPPRAIIPGLGKGPVVLLAFVRDGANFFRVAFVSKLGTEQALLSGLKAVILRPGAARGADGRSPLPPLSRPKAPRSLGSRSCGLSGISASSGTGERPPRGRLASGLLRPLVMLSRIKIAVVGLHTLITCMALTWGGPSPLIVGSGLPTHGHPCAV